MVTVPEKGSAPKPGKGELNEGPTIGGVKPHVRKKRRGTKHNKYKKSKGQRYKGGTHSKLQKGTLIGEGPNFSILIRGDRKTTARQKKGNEKLQLPLASKQKTPPSLMGGRKPKEGKRDQYTERHNQDKTSSNRRGHSPQTLKKGKGGN